MITVECWARCCNDWMGTPDVGLTGMKFASYTAGNKLDLIDDTQLVGADCYVQPVEIFPPSLYLNSWLEGFYQTSTSTMHQHLKTADDTPKSQPYGKSPFQYYGPEQMEVLPEDFVDWVLVELRSPDDLETVLSRQAAYINASGKVRSVLEEDVISFPSVLAGSYHVVLQHRNHLPVISKDPLSLSGSGPVTFSFTGDNTKGVNTMKQMADGNWVQIAGDLDRDGLISNNDIANWESNRSGIGGYLFEDVDANAVINIEDHNVIKQNLGNTSFFEQ